MGTLIGSPFLTYKLDKSDISKMSACERDGEWLACRRRLFYIKYDTFLSLEVYVAATTSKIRGI